MHQGLTFLHTVFFKNYYINFMCLSFFREIVQPRDMITIPSEDSTYLHFCGQFCLSVFRHKKKQTDKLPDKWIDKRLERKPEKLLEKPAERLPDKPFCSVCKVSNRVRDTKGLFLQQRPVLCCVSVVSK